MSTSCNCTPMYPAPPPPCPPRDNPHITSCVKPVIGGFTDELKDKLEGIEENANNYVLPAANDDTLGGIIVGEGLSISEDGVLSVNPVTVVESIVTGDTFVTNEDGTLDINTTAIVESMPINNSLIINEDGSLGVNTEQFLTVDEFETIFQLDGGGASG